MEIRTKKQVERAANDAAVAKEYKSLRRQFPSKKPTRIMTAMADSKMFGYTTYQGIRGCLKRTQTI